MSERRPRRDRALMAALLRKRRRCTGRIDYEPSSQAQALIEGKRSQSQKEGETSTYSAILDAIIFEWAELLQIVYGGSGGSKNQAAELKVASNCVDSFAGPGPTVPARLHEFGGDTYLSEGIVSARARAYEFGWWERYEAEQARRAAARRVPCGAKRHRDGQPCQAKSEPGKRRCRFHGGRSTGPRTAEGKARALGNLRQNRAKPATMAEAAIDPIKRRHPFAPVGTTAAEENAEGRQTDRRTNDRYVRRRP